MTKDINLLYDTKNRYKFKYNCERTLDIYECQKLVDSYGFKGIQLYNLNFNLWLLKHANLSSIQFLKDYYKYQGYTICSRCLFCINFYSDKDEHKEHAINYHQTRTVNGLNLCDRNHRELVEFCSEIINHNDDGNFMKKRLLKLIKPDTNLALEIGLIEENRFSLNNYIDII